MSNSGSPQLNRQQKRAVEHIGSPLLVLAGAGSGKTSVITQKIAWLIQTCDYAPQSITAVTFTNKAAREMRSRVQKLLPGIPRNPQVATFHQLGLKIAQQHPRQINRNPGFSILDDQDSAAILKDILLNDSEEGDDLLGMLQQQISHWKSHCLSPDDAAQTAQSKHEQRWIEVYRRYQKALQSYNALDFDDLIYLPVQMLKVNTEVREKWQRKIRYLLVDEYQDTNVAQYTLVRLLLGKRHGLCVVGDDDQSIYTWRGANPENLNQLSKDFPDLVVVKLEQNYRSTNSILRCANQLISHNTHIFEKQLWSEKGPGESILVERLGNEELEAEYICNQIIVKRLQHQCAFKDFAVLVRSNFQAKILELKLQSQQIPFHITGGTSFFARNEIKDLIAYLRLLVNPDDDSAFLRIINTPRRKIGMQTLEELGNYARSREVSLFSCISEIGLEQQMSSAALDRLRRFSLWLTAIKTQLEKNRGIQEMLRELIEDIDYKDWLVQNSSSTAIAEKRMENIYFLLDSIDKEAKRISEANTLLNSDEVLEGVINKLLLRDLLDQQAEEEADNKVQIMTLHAAKGLEFNHVFIMGFEENILPHRNSIQAETIEEERRLAYVGITRAQKTLCITLARHRKQFGELLNCEPSRFLEELPNDLIQMQGFGEPLSGEDNKKQGVETLANLKALFD